MEELLLNLVSKHSSVAAARHPRRHCLSEQYLK